MSIRDDILIAMGDMAEYSWPKQIKVEYQAYTALRGEAELTDFTGDGKGGVRFQGIPLKPHSPLSMPPGSWEVVPGQCEDCDGRGYYMKPLSYDRGPEAMDEAIVIKAGENPFRGATCGTCNGAPLEPIKGSISCE